MTESYGVFGVAGEPLGAGAGGVLSGVAGLGAAGGVVAEEPGAGGVVGEVEAGGVGLSVGCVVIRPEYWTAA
jgi:hypothetical protein